MFVFDILTTTQIVNGNSYHETEEMKIVLHSHSITSEEKTDVYM